MAFDLIRQNPMGIVKGSLKQWGLLVSDTWFSVFAYVGGEDTAGNRPIHLVLYGLCILALVQLVRRGKQPFDSMMLASLLGLFLSVPFVPPGDAHKMRAYAATIPLMALLPAVGVSELLSWIPGKLVRESPEESISPTGLTVYSAFLTAVLLIAPYTVMKIAVPPTAQKPQCLPDEVPVVMHFAPGNEVRLIRESVMQLDWLPEFHYGRYKVFVHNLPNEEAFTILEKVEPPATLLLGYDIPTKKRVWLLAPTELMPSSYGILRICGKFSDTTDPMILRYGFYYPREITLQP